MAGHQHNFGDWPFADPVNVAAFTTVQVMAGTDPILLVCHDEDDGAWQMLGGATVKHKDVRLVCLGCLYSEDPTVGELSDLPFGWQAERDAPGLPWRRSPQGKGLGADPDQQVDD